MTSALRGYRPGHQLGEDEMVRRAESGAGEAGEQPGKGEGAGLEFPESSRQAPACGPRSRRMPQSVRPNPEVSRKAAAT